MSQSEKAVDSLAVLTPAHVMGLGLAQKDTETKMAFKAPGWKDPEEVAYESGLARGLKRSDWLCYATIVMLAVNAGFLWWRW